MYESLKQWINVPVVLKPFVRRSGTGDIEYGEPQSKLCYPVGETKIVRDINGVEVISNNQLYFDSTVDINKLDVIIFDGAELPIKSISVFYRDGVPDMRVVYL